MKNIKWVVLYFVFFGMLSPVIANEDVYNVNGSNVVNNAKNIDQRHIDVNASRNTNVKVDKVVGVDKSKTVTNNFNEKEATQYNFGDDNTNTINNGK